MKRCIFLFLSCCILMAVQAQQREPLYRSVSGNVHFVSEAPLELIEARSTALRGILEAESSRFAFTIPIKSFKGFNSPLQQEHFNENYLESEKFPDATFQGKIIEDVNLQENGTYAVRAKGMLTIHGVSKERIIPCNLQVQNGQIKVYSSFLVPLADHQISIPKLVYHKIADNIQVTLEASLQQDLP